VHDAAWHEHEAARDRRDQVAVELELGRSVEHPERLGPVWVNVRRRSAAAGRYQAFVQ
jgi:hypothetical protein